MNEIYVIYWSGTGNTEAMAWAVAKGIENVGGKPVVTDVVSAKADMLKDVGSFALGCPAMGGEQLEENDMEPFVAEVEGFVSGKTIGLFGSYDWGDGEWMREWVSRMEAAGAVIAGGEGVMANNAPDDEALAACQNLGEMLGK